MAIDPKLLVLKPVSELATVNNPTTGSLLFYDGGDELKKTNVSDFYNAMQSAYLGIATTTTTPPATGAYWYRVDAPGTYMGVTVTEADFKDAQGNYYDVTLEVKDGVASKKGVAKVVSTSTAKIETWSAKSYTQGSQTIKDDKIWEANADTLAVDIPGTSLKWVEVFSGSIDLDVSGGALSFDTFVNNSKNDETIENLIFSSSTYKIGSTYNPLTGTEVVGSNVANSGYIPIKKGDIIKIYAYSSATSGTANNGLITDTKKVRIKNLTSTISGAGKIIEFNYTAEQDGFIVANTYTGYNSDYRVEIARKTGSGKYYIEWSQEKDDLFLNKKQKEIFIHDSTIPYTLPSTTTNHASGAVFYDVDGIPLPVGFYQLKIWQSIAIATAALKVSGVYIRDIAPKVKSDSERINRSSDGYSNITFEVTEENATLDINVLQLYPNAKIYKGSKGKEYEKVFLTPDDLEDLSVLSKSTSAEIPSPKSLLKLEFNTDSNLPTVVGTSISGVLKYNDFQGNSFKKFATLEVQGTSSAGYPKKNWTFELFNDAALKSKFELSIGKLISHSEFIFKADYVDITHTHNIVGNHIWEQMVQSRKGYPRRETESLYVEGNNGIDASRFDTKAIGHVDGFACELTINGAFYGLGNFNIGKKRNNYNIDNSNPNHVQLGDAIGQQNLYSFTPSQWELRSPKVSGYEEGQPITDSNVMSKINRLFSFNASSQTNITANIDDYYMRRNIVDYYIFTQTIYNFDGVSKNYLLTTWDGNVWAFMPYDLDSIFGMQFNGSSFFSPTANVYAHQNLNPNTLPFWNKIYQALKVDIDSRYAELRGSVLNIDNIYNLLKAQETKYGLSNYQKEISRWSDRPKLNSVPRIIAYMQKRFNWLDSYFGY